MNDKNSSRKSIPAYWFLAVLMAIPALLMVLLAGLFVWHHLNTRGMAYFGRTQRERELFKKKVARRGRILAPLMRPFRASFADPNRFATSIEGLYVPSNTCNKQSFGNALRYEPQANDVFVVTQMKCGTTWMQQLVYEVLSLGQGDLSDEGHGHMAAVSPWLESFNGVSVAEAPPIGPSRRRIIKTHLPASHCPFNEKAKYVYVTRHPVACFVSCADFYNSVAGPMTPPEGALLDWFCSEDMWWGSWPAHVDGFWRRAQQAENVQFFHFEEMKVDPSGVVRRLAAFLEVPLSEAQLSQVVEKGSFAYMKAHEAQFEMMIPPSFFSAEASFFKSGSARRHEEATSTEKARVSAFCREKLAGSAYPLRRFYEDVAAGG